MATMAEMAGLRPLTMAEQAGLTPIDPGDVPVDTTPAPVEQPGIMARIGRGALDIYQGAAQRGLQVLDMLPRQVSTEELRAYQSPDEAKLSDEELQKKFQGESLSQDYTKEVNEDLQRYDQARQGQGRDWARIGGSILGAAPLGLIGAGRTLAARAGLGAIGGGVTGALQYTPSNQASDTAVNTLIGAGTGAVAAPVLGKVGDVISQGVKWLMGRIAGLRAPTPTAADVAQAVPEVASLAPEQQAAIVGEAQAQVGQTGQMNAEALSRKANLLKQGVTPTQSMVTRDPADWTVERNLQKLGQSPDPQLASTGRALTDVYAANDKALAGKLGDMSQGLPQATQEAHGLTVMKGLGDLADASQKQVSQLYDAVRTQQGDNLASDARQLYGTLDALKDNTYAEKLVSSVTNKLRRFGMVDGEGNLTDKTLTVTQAEELRKFVNTLPNDYGKKDIIRSIDADVLSGAGGDAFAGARGAAAARFGMLENPATQKALGTLGELSQGKTAQNFIKSQVVSGAAQDVDSLVDTIAKIPDDTQRAQTQNALKAGVLQYLQDKAINANSGKFSGASLNTAMREIGDVKLQKILGPDDLGNLKSLARAGLDATYEPPYSAVNHANTAPTLVSLSRVVRGLPFGENVITDTAEEALERSGYRGQLAKVLAARAPGLAPRVPATIEGIAKALPRSAPVVAAGINPMLNARRKKPNQGAQ